MLSVGGQEPTALADDDDAEAEADEADAGAEVEAGAVVLASSLPAKLDPSVRHVSAAACFANQGLLGDGMSKSSRA